MFSFQFVANVVLRSCAPGDSTYEIQIQTGIWRGFGTTANVGINIFGEEGSSGAIILTDFSLCRSVFYRGGVTNFFVSLPRSLGKLVKLWIWHDNFGQSPSWFLQQVTITESNSRNKWHFFACSLPFADAVLQMVRPLQDLLGDSGRGRINQGW